MTLAGRVKQLVMKNPVNTTRINHLVRLFPDAKFIYLHRDPEEVLKSTYKLFTKFLAWYSFRDIGEAELRENIHWVYYQTIAQYQAQKQVIPAGNLTEISYQDFIRDPLSEMERIYRELQLEGFASAKSRFWEYIETQSTFVADKY